MGRRVPVAALAVAVLAVTTVAALARTTGTSGPSQSSAARTSHPTAPPKPVVTRSSPVARAGSGPPPVKAPWLAPVSAAVTGHLAAGSRPSALPADLLIVDKFNNRLIVVDPRGRIRWQFPRRGDLAPGQTFKIPDDAFFSPDGRSIIATQEDQSVVTEIDITTHRIVWRYGVPGRPGMSANHLSNPDDAMMMPNGDVITADIKNCRMLIIAPGAHVPLHVIGVTTTACVHAPPRHWGSPNGVFPMSDHHYLVTEINGDWVNSIGLNGQVLWSIHPPGVRYPSDSNQIGPDRYLTVDYSSPGQVVVFNRAGQLVWRYRGQGNIALDHPSLALPLANGDVVVNDDFNHRVIVIDPHSNRIVWQYGVTGVPGSRAGYLDNPDGIDLVPPSSFLVTHASSMGLWPR
jgi:hypothetical protein